MKDYLKEFHPDIIGLTGSYDDIKKVCKSFRVYFSTPTDVKPGDDYLVDHSIFFYLMGRSKQLSLDPEGHFVEVFGQQQTAEEVATKLKQHLSDWKQSHK